MVKFMIEIATEDCLKRCLQDAKKCLKVYDDIEKKNVGLDVVINAVRSEQIGILTGQYGLRPGTVGHLLTMSLRDLVNDRRPYYEKVVEQLTPLVEKKVEQE